MNSSLNPALPDAASTSGLGPAPSPAPSAGRSSANAGLSETVCCPPSIARRLARTMGLFMLMGLGLLSGAKYAITAMQMQMDQQATLDEKHRIIARFVEEACEAGEPALLHKLALYEPVRGNARLDLWRGDGSALFRDPVQPFDSSVGVDFAVPASTIAGGEVRARLELDTSHDQHMLRGMAITLILTTVLGTAAAGLAIRWLVRRELRPLLSLAGQTRAISPQRLDQRLTLDRPSEELLPWMQQFNALMDRLERAYGQLEAFNADVAHELRTPLATLIGETELALSRERDSASLQDTLASNLEELQRLSALVNDMLFLSQADRGAVARRGLPVSLAALATDVAEYHEAGLEEAGLSLRVVGDATLPVDEALVKRAVSNLIGNAARFAERGSTVVVRVEPEGEDQVRVSVQNRGAAIADADLPRLFDRFFRADVSRCCEDRQHHGLGLAIVAAIARMHNGRTFASSAQGTTQVGFTLART